MGALSGSLMLSFDCSRRAPFLSQSPIRGLSSVFIDKWDRGAPILSLNPTSDVLSNGKKKNVVYLQMEYIQG